MNKLFTNTRYIDIADYLINNKDYEFTSKDCYINEFDHQLNMNSKYFNIAHYNSDNRAYGEPEYVPTYSD